MAQLPGPPRTPIRTGVSWSLTNSAHFAGVSAGASTGCAVSAAGRGLTWLFAQHHDLKGLTGRPHTSARLLRNKFGHDFGPTNVGRMFEHAFLIPKKVAFLGCRENLLAYLKQNFGHITGHEQGEAKRGETPIIAIPPEGNETPPTGG